jgi:hypothetical protein
LRCSAKPPQGATLRKPRASARARGCQGIRIEPPQGGDTLRWAGGSLCRRIHPRIRACPPYFSYYGRREGIYETEHLAEARWNTLKRRGRMGPGEKSFTATRVPALSSPSAATPSPSESEMIPHGIKPRSRFLPRSSASGPLVVSERSPFHFANFFHSISS